MIRNLLQKSRLEFCLQRAVKMLISWLLLQAIDTTTAQRFKGQLPGASSLCLMWWSGVARGLTLASKDRLRNSPAYLINTHAPPCKKKPVWPNDLKLTTAFMTYCDKAIERIHQTWTVSAEHK